MKGPSAAFLLILVAAVISAALLLSGSPSRAGHDPAVTAIIAGDVDPQNTGPGGAGPDGSGNFVVNDGVQNNQWDPNVQTDPNAVGMRMGPIDFCRVVTWTDTNDNIFFVDIVIQNVTDLTGYQIRINYDAARVTFQGAVDFDFAPNSGFLPGNDRRTVALSEAVGFVNLIPESQTAGTGPSDGHRPNTASTDTSAPGSVLLGDVYQGTRTAAISSDTPSAQAPDGGLLVRTAWTADAGSDGQVVQFHMAGDPTTGGSGPSPGSKILVFDPSNPSGNIERVLPENHLRDFFIASDGPAAGAPACQAQPTPPPPPTTPTPTVTPTDTSGPATPTATPTTGGATATPTGGAASPTASPAAGARTPTPTRTAGPAGLPPTGGGLPGSSSLLPVYGLIASLAVIGAVGGLQVWRKRSRI